jgi:hypothetical protein
MWTQAHSFLKNAKELFVIGYSLNPVDHPARLLFGIALSENTTLTGVTVVSPAATEWPQFLLQIDKPLVNVNLKFEDWVNSTRS